MKTWKRALALVLALVMALSLVALPSFAAGEEDSAGLPNGVSVVNPGGPTEGVTGMEMSKTLQLNADGKTGTLTLEAYATGNSQVVQKNVPWTSSWSWTSLALWRIPSAETQNVRPP